MPSIFSNNLNMYVNAPGFTIDDISNFNSPDSIKLAYERYCTAYSVPRGLLTLEEYSTRDWKKIFNLLWLTKYLIFYKSGHAEVTGNTVNQYSALRYSDIWNIARFSYSSNQYHNDTIELDNNFTNLLLGVSPSTISRHYLDKYTNFIQTMMGCILDRGFSYRAAFSHSNAAYAVNSRKLMLSLQVISTAVTEQFLNSIRPPVPLRLEPNEDARRPSLEVAYSSGPTEHWQTYRENELPVMAIQDLQLYPFYHTSNNNTTSSSRNMPIETQTNEEQELQRNWDRQVRALNDEISNSRRGRNNVNYLHRDNFGSYFSNAINTSPNQHWAGNVLFNTCRNAAATIGQNYYSRIGDTRTFDSIEAGLHATPLDNLTTYGFRVRHENSFMYIVRYKRSNIERMFGVGNNGPRRNRTRINREINNVVTFCNQLFGTFGATFSTRVVNYPRTSGNTEEERQIRIFILSGMPAINSPFQIGVSPLQAQRASLRGEPLPMPEWYSSPLSNMSAMYAILCEDSGIPGVVEAVAETISVSETLRQNNSLSEIIAELNGGSEDRPLVSTQQELARSIEILQTQIDQELISLSTLMSPGLPPESLNISSVTPTSGEASMTPSSQRITEESPQQPESMAPAEPQTSTSLQPSTTLTLDVLDTDVLEQNTRQMQQWIRSTITNTAPVYYSYLPDYHRNRL